MSLRNILLIILFCLTNILSWSQNDTVYSDNKLPEIEGDTIVMDTIDVEACIASYFNNYKPSFRTGLPIAAERVVINDGNQTLDVYAKEGFASQTFTPEQVEAIYSDMRSYLPGPYNQYDLKIYGFKKELSLLVPNYYKKVKDRSRLWGPINYDGNEWVRNMSRPLQITSGLQGAHMAIWPSHGNYYDHGKSKWKWQRPKLFCTTEDLFTRSFVVPFLLPMLENSGAVAYTPRERDQHSVEIIIDNDSDNISQCGTYTEVVGVEPFDYCDVAGFKQIREVYEYGQNPHVEGTARTVVTTSDKQQISTCRWVPVIPEDGEYAVYVTYPHTELNVSDATYTVYHGGIATEVRVNQQMGSGTWVYLGTFCFDKGNSLANSITLSNYSQTPGVVNADAVRIGGGMGNVARGGMVSGLPRYLEGSLYYTQWAGMPFEVYNTKNGRNDYADDINTRSNTLNYLAGGSPYMPDSAGLGVPMELSLAVHSDAGARADDTSIVGTLSIYTYLGDRETYDLQAGIDRLASSDLASLVQTDICRDLSDLIGRDWTRRELYNRNYSECRKPEVPSMILETLSHQNFADMLYGHDPNFKFTLSRAIYKAITRFVATQHEREYTIQPLPVRAFTAEALDGVARLTWQAPIDPLEPTATPSSYIVYTSREGADFDNGTLITGGATTVDVAIEKDMVYRFKVSACNEGGESFPSEVLAVLSASQPQHRVMILNGFTRLSAPATLSTRDSVGFDLNRDIGVAYRNTAEYCGAQTGFMRSKIRVETAGGLGYSGEELIGRIIAGNSFDYPYAHALAIRNEANSVSISSMSSDALTMHNINLPDYQMLDVIFGLQKDCGKSSIIPYKTFTPQIQQTISNYLSNGGHMLVSGAYVGSDMSNSNEQQFTSANLGYINGGSLKAKSVSVGEHMGSLVVDWNPKRYAVQFADVLVPRGSAIQFATYDDGSCAGVISDSAIVLGFPFEAIVSDSMQKVLMQKVLGKLLPY